MQKGSLLQINVTFIGTGIMGARIAGHLMDAGLNLTVYNRTREKAEGLLAGPAGARSPGGGRGRRRRGLHDGRLPHRRRGRLPGRRRPHPRRQEARLARRPHHELPAARPTSTTRRRWRTSTPSTARRAGRSRLTLIIGAAEKDVAPVPPARDLLPVSALLPLPPGGGQTAKLCNQVSLASCMVGYADALALAEQSGIDAEKVLEVMASDTGGSGASATLAPKSLAGDYKPGFLAQAPAQGHRARPLALRGGARHHAPRRRDGVHALPDRRLAHPSPALTLLLPGGGDLRRWH